MATRIKKPRLDLNLRQVPGSLKNDINRIFGREIGRMLLDHIEEIRFLFTKIQPEVRHVAESIIDNITFPYQTLVTSASNLVSGELYGVTKTKSVLLTASETSVEFDWYDSLRESHITVGPGNGVEPHAFIVNPQYNLKGFRVGFDGSGNLTLIQRNGIAIPVNGQPTRLMFVRYVEDTAMPNNIRVEPVDLAYGTTIKLWQRTVPEWE